MNGMGIGNPNEEFTPNVSCIGLSSTGGTGRIAWGFQNGQVATTYASRMMESNRSAARFARCRVEDEHRGIVNCIQFAGREQEVILSGCSHGQVKLWDTKRMRCLWTGEGKKEDTILPDACAKLQFVQGANAVVVASQSGDILVWWGFQFQDDGSGSQSLLGAIRSLRVIKPVDTPHPLDTLFVDPNLTTSQVSLLLHYDSDATFTRLAIDLSSGQTTSTVFCEGPVGPLISFKPCFRTKPVDSPAASAPLTPIIPGSTSLSISFAANIALFSPSSFILAGDSLGRVCVWAWDVKDVPEPSVDASTQKTLSKIKSIQRWEAHDDGGVCAIETNDFVIVTGRYSSVSF